ncbi:GntT/GntP/DsdX family permease [Arthrobacter globiformis]|uniref:GntT/GntP/DsdX family permease n=1 Tax=Arthrobacter globiformis TaxID=1665 RepID=UPI0009FDC7F7|nr:hypothetical protein [Arthrobacter globiformis]
MHRHRTDGIRRRPSPRQSSGTSTAQRRQVQPRGEPQTRRRPARPRAWRLATPVQRENQANPAQPGPASSNAKITQLGNPASPSTSSTGRFRAQHQGVGPLSMILLVVGAGAFFGAVLSATGVGKAVADSLAQAGLPIILSAFGEAGRSSR